MILKKKMAKGKYITLEGIDGVGKSYYLRRLFNKRKDLVPIFDDKLRGFGLKVFNALKNDDLFHRHGHPICEGFVFLAAEFYEYDKLIMPKLKKGKVVIGDRGIDTVALYASIGQNDGKIYEKFINARKAFGRIPDMTIILTDKFENILKRLEERDRKLTKDEIKFLKKAYLAYLKLAKSDKRFKLIDIYKKTDKKIVNEIISCLKG